MIEPIPGQMVKNAWEHYPKPMDSPEYIIMLKINELIAAYNKLAALPTIDAGKGE